MFAAKKTKTITIDDDGTAVAVTIRKLNWTALEAAQQEQSRHALQVAQQAGPEMMKVWREPEGAAKKEPTIAEQRETRYRQYDRATVLARGVAAWTSPVDVTKGVVDLDDETATRLHREILDLSLPSLEPAAEEEARGEG